MGKSRVIKEIILDFENSNLTSKEAIDKINQISDKKIDEYSLRNYWRSETLDNFVSVLLIELGEKKIKELTDTESLILIEQIINNVNNDELLEKNSEILEIKYSKPKGSVLDWVFQDDITNSEEILKKLKENNNILL